MNTVRDLCRTASQREAYVVVLLVSTLLALPGELWASKSVLDKFTEN